MTRGVASRLPLVAVIVFALCSLGGGTALAGNASTTHTQLPFTNFPVVSPCNGELVLFAGEVDIILHANQGGNGGHVVISDHTHATGTGDQGNGYILSGVGSGQFDVPTVDGTYLVPFHVEILTEGAAPNFAADGIDTVVVSGGQVTAFFVSSVTSTTCHG
jgi:hypothetical protein